MLSERILSARDVKGERATESRSKKAEGTESCVDTGVLCRSEAKLRSTGWLFWDESAGCDADTVVGVEIDVQWSFSEETTLPYTCDRHRIVHYIALLNGLQACAALLV